MLLGPRQVPYYSNSLDPLDTMDMHHLYQHPRPLRTTVGSFVH